MKTTSMNPYGLTYLLMVTCERPNPAIASASIATTLGRISDHAARVGLMGMSYLLPEALMVIEENVTSSR